MVLFRFALLGLWLWTLLVGVADFERSRVDLRLPDGAPATEHIVDLTSVIPFQGSQLLLTIGVANTSVDQTLTVVGEGVQGEALTVGPASTGRVQWVWDKIDRAPQTVLRLTGTHAEWRLTFVQVSNASGFNRGVVNFVVVPREQQITKAPLWLWFLSALAAWTLLRPGPRPSASKWRTVLLATAVLSVALLMATSVSGLVSPFQVVLEPRSYLLGLILCCAAFGAPLRLRVPAFVYGVAGLVLFGAIMVQELQRFDGNYSGFLHITRDVAARAPFLEERPELRDSLRLYEYGYDAQFMYLMAFDPWLQRFASEPARYRDVADDPPYRFARMGYSALTSVLSAGQPERFPRTMMWLILAGHLLLGLGLVGVTMKSGAPAWWAASYVAIPGFIASLTFGLPEALACAGLVLGVYGLLSGRAMFAAIAFAAALLVRETGLILAVAAVCALGPLRVQQRVQVLIGTLAPMAAWRLFVGATLFPDWGGRAYLPSPGDFVLPFSGFAHLFTAVSNGTHPVSETNAAVVYPPLLMAAGVLAVWALFKTRSALALAATVYAVMAVSLNYAKIWMHVPSGERGTTELFLTLLLLALVHHKTQPSLSRCILWCWPAVAVYTFFISPGAAAARAGLLLIR